jgi:hypothetical protein
MPKFLGFETMSREDHLRVGLFGLVLLSLQCVLLGLVTDAELRGWAIHAVAAGLGAWALVGVEPLPVRATSATGIVAVVNEAVMYLDRDQPLKYVIPALLLLGTAIWVLERSMTMPATELSSLTGATGSSGGSVWDDSISSLDLPPPPPPMHLRNLWAPIVTVAGIGMTVYGFLAADWIMSRALFGLIQADLTYSQLRDVWSNLGAPPPVVEGFVGIAYVLGYVGMLLALIGSMSALVRQFEIGQVWRVAGASVIGATSVMQFLVVVGLLTAEANISVLSGAWAAPLGLGLAALGFWVSTARP